MKRCHTTRFARLPARAKLASATLLALGLAPTLGSAATIIVTEAGDGDVAASSTCTLRQAILSMNNSTVSGDCVKAGAFGTNDTIRFAPNVTTVTLADVPNNELLVSAPNLVIEGHRDANVVVTRNISYSNVRYSYSPTFQVSNQFGIVHSNASVGGNLTLSRMTITEGHSATCGGGVNSDNANVTLLDSTVTGNHSTCGGGGIRIGQGKLTVNRSHVDGNQLEFPTPPSQYLGGGICSDGGDIEVQHSTVSGNKGVGQFKYTFVGGGGISSRCHRSSSTGEANKILVAYSTISGNMVTKYAGGGIFTIHGAVEVRNSTISGNQVEFGSGGAIYTRDGSIVVSNSTLSGNSAPGGAAVAVKNLSSPVLFRHVTLTNNQAQGQSSTQTDANGIAVTYPDASVLAVETVASGGSVDFESTLISGNSAANGHSIFSVDNNLTITGSNNLLDVNEQPVNSNVTFANAPLSGAASLQPLADNGGSTKSHALGLLSAALDAAETTDTFTLGTDQRGAGFARLSGPADIGAFEAQPAGACGSASGGTSSFASWFAPASNLCTNGSGASAVTLSSGQWQWTCTGTAAGIPVSVSCSAPIRPPQATLAALDGGTSADLSFNSKFGEAVSLKATLTGDGTTTPAGFATFCSGGTPNPANVTAPCGTGTAVCSNVLLSAAGTATCAVPPSSLIVGSLPFSVAFYSDSSYADATATGTLQVSAANTTTAISSESHSPAVIGAPVIVSVQVAPVLPGAGTPAGVVTVSDGSVNCSATLSNGVGSCSLTPPAATGSHTIQASYAATTNFAASSTSAALTVNPANTTTAITSVSPSPAVLGAPVTVSVRVAPVLPGAGTPTGGVTVSDGSVNCSATLSNGVGSCSLTPPASTGGHTIQASYAATTNFAASSTSASLTESPASTTTALSAQPASSVLGQSVVLTAAVQSSTGIAPTGTVAFSEGGVALSGCGGLVVSSGAAICTIATLAVGPHSISATYQPGDTKTISSASTASVLVDKLAALVGLTSSANPSQQGSWVTFTASVSSAAPASAGPSSARTSGMLVSQGATQAGATATPTGTITFKDGASALGTLALVNGSATFVTPFTTAGSHTITAAYSGDAATAAASITLVQAVSAADPVMPAPASSTWLLGLLGGLLAVLGLARVRARG